MAVTDIAIHPQLDPELAESLKRQVMQLDRQLDRSYDGPQPIAATGVLEQLGRQLWSTTGLDADALLGAISHAKDTQTPVRLVVTNADCHHLPWELLYHDHPKLGFVARHPWCAVIRRFDGSGQHKPQCLPRPFRLLFFVASPEDLDPERSRLDFEREEELLFTALDGAIASGDVHIDVAEDGGLPTLIERLETQRYHAVILSLHGTQARDTTRQPEWGLLFEDVRTGRGAPVAGSILAEKLEELPSGHRPSLVVLSACRSAKSDESADSITSVARHLHESGFDRVLGMRLSVFDSAASAFSTELFRRAARGESLGRAVTLTRRNVAEGLWLGENVPKGSADGDVFAQWTLPVLLDRTADGPLVDMEAEATLAERPPPPRIIPGDHTVHVSSRAAFIGRRRFIRQYLRPFLDGDQRQLFFTGPGGVGKTTLAGWFARKLSELNPQTRLLGFRVPVNADGLLAIESDPDLAAENRDRLVAYALLETPYDAAIELTYFVVPPVVRELIGAEGFDPAEQLELHRAMGTYHRFQGAYFSRVWSDDIEAIYHFRCATEHVAADELSERVCDFYYRISNFAGAKALTEDIIERAEPPAPWWALNRYGMCQQTLGFTSSALDAFKRAHPLAPTQKDLGTTLNNIGQIYMARGDYETALRYLEQSLQIQQEVGDKTKMIATLHNMACIVLEANNIEQAMSLWSQALSLAIETQNAMGIFNVAGTLGSRFAQAGDHDQARQLLQMAVDVGQRAGFPDVDRFETILRQLP